MIRLKITPRFTDAGVRLLLEWVDIAEGELIAGVVASEEFELKQAREGCAYVTRGSFEEGTFLPGTFWIDEAGRRHFVLDAEAGHVGLFGENVEQRIGG